MTIFLIVIAFIVLLLITLAISYNGFVKLRNQSDEAFSTMDIFLKKRYDMIPNLVEIVKQYAIHERETLERVIQARSMAMGAQTFEERTQNENVLSGALKSLFAVSESYPQLKADGNFLNLQNQLIALEDDISQSRKYYNGVIKVMNNKVEMFPSNLYAAILGFRRYPYFMVDDYERQNVQVRF
ncbi:MAG: LemA family protein [Candidatus Alkaliphilus sp. MAG34]